MSESLTDTAVNVEDIADLLQLWLDRALCHAADISASMSELLEIGSILRTLDDALSSPAYYMVRNSIEEELFLILRSLNRSLAVVRKSLGSVGPIEYLSGAVCEQSWGGLHAIFLLERSTLYERLELYRLYLQSLFAVLQGYQPTPDTASFYSRIQHLLALQAKTGPGVNNYPAEPAGFTLSAKVSPGQRASSFRYTSNSSYTMPPPQSPGLQEWEYPNPPLAPEIPLSPTVSNTSSQTYSSGQTFSTASSLNPPIRHWATRILDGRHPATPLHDRATATVCNGTENPAAEQRLQSEGFCCVLRLPFQYAEISVQLHWRPTDCRARILYLTIDKQTGRPLRYSYPLTSLIMRRHGACLKLGRLNDSGRLDIWANLRFDVYERMVLFYCSFVALKKQDRVKPNQDFDDYIKSGEVEIFTGEIQDGHLKHFLRVYNDEGSGGLRIEATARRGRMVKTPIWTAFISQNILSRRWAQRASSRIVRFRDLQPYIFCDNYIPTRDARGHYEVHFTSKAYADEFLFRIDQIRSG